jgi:hypothetical protein
LLGRPETAELELGKVFPQPVTNGTFNGWRDRNSGFHKSFETSIEKFTEAADANNEGAA